MKGLLQIALGLTLIFIISCDFAYYSNSSSFKENQWLYDDPRTFTFQIRDTSKVYDMLLTLDHTDEFPYQNLYLKTSTSFPTDTTISQLLSIDMANEAGFWFGDCTGSNCQLSILIQSGVHFQDIGTYHLKLVQHTRSDTLRGLSSIALKLIELEYPASGN